ncbi:hypothetical protein LWI29_026800 [Acer saccharum]|uniref:Uncharacterized protein n=1 Tax=Acer saccharum TaxID=4024 RepID=A0AA39RN96_ACESA|nr:hypothetical protein LWI29_026800 [Acer saccharum]
MRAPGLDRLNVRIKSPIDGNPSKVSSIEERSVGKDIEIQTFRPGDDRREGNINEFLGGGAGSVEVQVEYQTDSRLFSEIASKQSQSNILGRVSGPGSTQFAGLLLEGPMEETLEDNLKGGKGSGPGPMLNNPQFNGADSDTLLAGPMIEEDQGEELSQFHRLDPKKSANRNWKQSARAQSSNYVSKFRKLQTVNTKGKQGAKGNGSLSTSHSKFNLVGKRTGLGKFKSVAQVDSHKRGTLSSSLKRWEVKFGKRKLCIGAINTSGSPNSGKVPAGAEDEEDCCCEETKDSVGVISGAALSADEGPAAALMWAGSIGGAATADGESDVMSAGGEISTCRDATESMYGGNSGEGTVGEGAD